MNTYDSGLKLIYRFVKDVFPEVSAKLKEKAAVCRKSNDGLLAGQALDSIRLKRFHCLGGSVYALYPGVDPENVLDFIVAFQTISDYLDNLCDRAGVKDEAAFRRLHLSMLDAVDPLREPSDYYRFYPFKNDGGYLQSLVSSCREAVLKLPGRALVSSRIKKYVQLYSHLQTYKHLAYEVREKCLREWAGYYLPDHTGLSWWEFSAASGSTLGIFTLFAAAYDPDLSSRQVDAIDSVYFPWICGLHILLDYYIDSHEDTVEGDLNFTSYYGSLKECEERLLSFYEESVAGCGELKYPLFHLTVVKGLLAMYLSDSKALWGLNRIASRNILKGSGPSTGTYYRLCRVLRFAGVL